MQMLQFFKAMVVLTLTCLRQIRAKCDLRWLILNTSDNNDECH